MNDIPAFHLLSLDILMGEDAVPSRERPDISGAPLSFEEHEMLSEARARVAEQEQTNWRMWLGLD